jgi:hypothetical protein
VIVDALFAVAVLCGCIAAWAGNRTAWPLLASAAASSLLIWAGVPFNLALWLLIDVAVIAAITSRPMSVRDTLVVVLFVPVWALYGADLPYAGKGISVIVALQLLLTFPVRRAWAKVRGKPLPSDPPDTHHWLRGRHA